MRARWADPPACGERGVADEGGIGFVALTIIGEPAGTVLLELMELAAGAVVSAPVAGFKIGDAEIAAAIVRVAAGFPEHGLGGGGETEGSSEGATDAVEEGLRDGVEFAQAPAGESHGVDEICLIRSEGLEFFEIFRADGLELFVVFARDEKVAAVEAVLAGIAAGGFFPGDSSWPGGAEGVAAIGVALGRGGGGSMDGTGVKNSSEYFGTGRGGKPMVEHVVGGFCAVEMLRPALSGGRRLCHRVASGW